MDFDNKETLELLAKCSAFPAIGNAIAGFLLNNIAMAVMALACSVAFYWWMHLLKLKEKNGRR